MHLKQRSNAQTNTERLYSIHPYTVSAKKSLKRRDSLSSLSHIGLPTENMSSIGLLHFMSLHELPGVIITGCNARVFVFLRTTERGIYKNVHYR